MFENRHKNKQANFLKIIEHPQTMLDNIPYFEKRKKTFLLFKYLKYFSIFVIFIVIFFGLTILVNFSRIRHIYENSIAGKQEAELAIAHLKENNLEEATTVSRSAENNFQSAISDLEIYQQNFVLKHTPIVSQELNNLLYLLNSAHILTHSITEVVDFASNLEWFLSRKDSSFTKLTKSEKRRILERIYEAGPELNGIQAEVDLALLNLDHVRMSGLLWPFKDKIKQVRERVREVSDILEKAVPMAEVLPPLLGYPQNSTYLVLLQNNDELRPTGGFIGTYGILEMDNGDIKRFDTHDIYHLDMPVKDKVNIIPPEPIKKYLVPKWYMRDANWSPDWPTAAKEVTRFYKMENNLLPLKNRIDDFTGEFNGVIAITPKLVTDLLTITGPIKVENVEYNSDNFMDLLQYRVEKGFSVLGVSSWQRKEVIGEILKEMKIKLLDLPPDQLIIALHIASTNLEEKNILLFFSDQELENYTVAQGWAGEVKKTDNDFLMIVDANLGSFKTDAVISRGFEYSLRETNGKLTADLKINYMHKGTFDWKTTTYRTYTRVYVPLGSKLLRADGFSEDTVSISNELGKTVFGIFLKVEPGQIGNLHFIYELPAEINFLTRNNGYKLSFSKQPGVESIYCLVDLQFENSVKSYSPTGFFVSKFDDGVKWEGDLKSDTEYIVNFY